MWWLKIYKIIIFPFGKIYVGSILCYNSFFLCISRQKYKIKTLFLYDKMILNKQTTEEWYFNLIYSHKTENTKVK